MFKNINAIATGTNQNQTSRVIADPDALTFDDTPSSLLSVGITGTVTVPEGYTEGVAKTHRYKALGNGFTVDVIAFILSCIPLVIFIYLITYPPTWQTLRPDSKSERFIPLKHTATVDGTPTN